MEARNKKCEEIARHDNVRGPFAFVHVNLLSGVRATINLRRYTGAIAIANSLAFVSECIDPISDFIRLTRRDLMRQALRYIVFGEGEMGLMFYTILLPFWDTTPEDDVRPFIFLMSD